jgi:hypothetical protein
LYTPEKLLGLSLPRPVPAQKIEPEFPWFGFTNIQSCRSMLMNPIHRHRVPSAAFCNQSFSMALLLAPTFGFELLDGC